MDCAGPGMPVPGPPTTTEGAQRMKRIEAVIRASKVEDVRQALEDLGHHGLTIAEVKGQGVQGGIGQRWRGEEYHVDYLPKVCVVAVVHDHEAQEVVDAVATAARTGRIGDGKIFISTIDEVVRVRTGESGAGTL